MARHRPISPSLRPIPSRPGPLLVSRPSPRRPACAQPPGQSPAPPSAPNPSHPTTTPGPWIDRLKAQSALLAKLLPRALPKMLPRALAVVVAVLLSYALLSSDHFQLFLPADATTATDGSFTVEPMPFEQPGMSFPGSAFYYLAPEPAQPTAQSTGPLPLAPDARWDSSLGDSADGPQPLGIGPAARPLAQIASAVDRERALSCLTAAIYYEAATEPDAGQKAVAQVILNRLAHPAFPKTVCGVVYQGSEKATGCQFTFSCDGSMARHPMALFWNRAELVAREALNGYVYAPVGLATHYHTFQVHPYWADSLNFISQIGAHRFYRMEGLAGSPELFSGVYRGGEPMPGPHPRSLMASARPDIAADPLALQRAFASKAMVAQYATPAVVISHAGPALPPPAYTSEVLRHGGDAAYRASNLPESRAVNPEYQNSGRWLGDPQ